MMGLGKGKAATRPSSGGLDEEIVSFEDAKTNKLNPWTLRHSFEGTQIFGATGSGKTSGSGYHLATGMLRCGFGGLVLTVKPEDYKTWIKYGKATGRSGDFLFIEPGGRYRFNFLDYEYRHHRKMGTNLTQNLVSLFCTAMEGGQERESASDPYWEDALRQLLTNAIDLVALATGTVRLDDIAKVIRTAPESRSEAESKAWQEQSVCWRYLKLAESKTTRAEDRKDLEETLDYWMIDYAGLTARTRSVVVSSFTSKATTLLRSPLRELFCSDVVEGEDKSDKQAVTPDDSHAGKVLILNLPVKEFGEAGRFAQIIFKTVWQRATERRDEKAPGAQPVFLWADEAQHFITNHDMLFQQTARTKRAATVYLTQNISNYYAQFTGRNGTATADSLVGNLQTKIFHANGDPVTNEWAERLFGKDRRLLQSQSQSLQDMSKAVHESILPVVPTVTFPTLRKGGPPDGRVEAVIFQGGRLWEATSSKYPHVLKAVFRQKLT